MTAEDPTRYTVGAFLKDKALFLATIALLLVFLSIVFRVVGVSESGVLILDGIVIVWLIAYLFYAYGRDAAFWQALSKATEDSSSGAYFVDLVEDPKTLQGRIAYEAAASLAHADNELIASLRQARRAHSEYIESWVHEAKTPLAAAKLVTKRMQGTDALVLRRELERMGDLIDQALFSARMDTLDRDYLIREVSLEEVVKEACKSHMHYLTSLDVSLDMRIGHDVKVYADKTWLAFIITQLVINAAKYDAKTIVFTASTPDEESSRAHTTLEVRDDGCGIPASDVPRVFERGFTGEVGRAHGSATGMGLFLVASMCERMGLSIMLASEEGVGTRVVISFPHDRRLVSLHAGETTQDNLTDM